MWLVASMALGLVALAMSSLWTIWFIDAMLVKVFAVVVGTAVMCILFWCIGVGIWMWRNDVPFRLSYFLHEDD